MKSFVVAKAIVVNEKGQMLALRRSASDIRRPGQWDFPGGHVDEGEDMTAAVCREAIEETGLELAGPRLVFAMSEMTEHGAGTWLVFVAHISGAPKVVLSHEHDDFKWMTSEEFLALVSYDRQIRMVSYISENNLLENDR